MELRCQGTRLLSETLINLSSHQLPQDDGEMQAQLNTLGVILFVCSPVHYLVAFYCDRLKDKVAVLPFVLRGLHAMVSRGHPLHPLTLSLCYCHRWSIRGCPVMTSSSSQEQYTAKYTTRSLFEHTVVLYKLCFLVQSLPQGERRLVYTILDYFISDYTQGCWISYIM